MSEGKELIRLHNGIVIDPETGRPVEGTVDDRLVKLDKKVREIAPPSSRRMARERNNGSYRTRLYDLPGEPRKITATCVVMGLFMLGLPDQDIAEATGFTVEQVQILRTTDLFDELHAKLVMNVRRAAQDQVRVAFEEASLDAADVMVDAMSSEDEKVRIAAAKDVLDRTGHRPVDVVEHRHSFDDEMRVRIIRDVPETSVPIIELDAEPTSAS